MERQSSPSGKLHDGLSGMIKDVWEGFLQNYRRCVSFCLNFHFILYRSCSATFISNCMAFLSSCVFFALSSFTSSSNFWLS